MEKARSITLTSLVVFEWLLAIHMRSDDVSLRKLGFWKNKPLLISISIASLLHLSILYIPVFQYFFHTKPLSLSDWGLALIPGITIFIIEAARKEFLPHLFDAGKWKPKKIYLFKRCSSAITIDRNTL